MSNPTFYHCGICEQYHPADWDADCRDDAARYAANELDEEYGVDGWDEVDMPD